MLISPELLRAIHEERERSILAALFRRQVEGRPDRTRSARVRELIRHLTGGGRARTARLEVTDR
jgi:hypothetical protein